MRRKKCFILLNYVLLIARTIIIIMTVCTCVESTITTTTIQNLTESSEEENAIKLLNLSLDLGRNQSHFVSENNVLNVMSLEEMTQFVQQLPMDVLKKLKILLKTDPKLAHRYILKLVSSRIQHQISNTDQVFTSTFVDSLVKMMMTRKNPTKNAKDLLWPAVEKPRSLTLPSTTSTTTTTTTSSPILLENLEILKIPANVFLQNIRHNNHHHPQWTRTTTKKPPAYIKFDQIVPTTTPVFQKKIFPTVKPTPFSPSSLDFSWSTSPPPPRVNRILEHNSQQQNVNQWSAQDTSAHLQAQKQPTTTTSTITLQQGKQTQFSFPQSQQQQQQQSNTNHVYNNQMINPISVQHSNQQSNFPGLPNSLQFSHQLPSSIVTESSSMTNNHYNQFHPGDQQQPWKFQYYPESISTNGFQSNYYNHNLQPLVFDQYTNNYETHSQQNQSPILQVQPVTTLPSHPDYVNSYYHPVDTNYNSMNTYNPMDNNNYNAMNSYNPMTNNNYNSMNSYNSMDNNLNSMNNYNPMDSYTPMNQNNYYTTNQPQPQQNLYPPTEHSVPVNQNGYQYNNNNNPMDQSNNNNYNNNPMDQSNNNNYNNNPMDQSNNNNYNNNPMDQSNNNNYNNNPMDQSNNNNYNNNPMDQSNNNNYNNNNQQSSQEEDKDKNHHHHHHKDQDDDDDDNNRSNENNQSTEATSTFHHYKKKASDWWEKAKSYFHEKHKKHKNKKNKKNKSNKNHSEVTTKVFGVSISILAFVAFGLYIVMLLFQAAVTSLNFPLLSGIIGLLSGDGGAQLAQFLIGRSLQTVGNDRSLFHTNYPFQFDCRTSGGGRDGDGENEASLFIDDLERRVKSAFDSVRQFILIGK